MEKIFEELLSIFSTEWLIALIILLGILLLVAIKLIINMVIKRMKSKQNTVLTYMKAGFENVDKQFGTLKKSMELAAIHRESQDRALNDLLKPNGSGYLEKKNGYFNQLLKDKNLA